MSQKTYSKMKSPTFVTAALLVSAALQLSSASAAMIVDTGTPTGSPDWLFFPSQYFAGQFSIADPALINSVEGYFSNNRSTAASGSVTIAIHSNGVNNPGAAIFSASLSVSAGEPMGWHGVSGLSWNLNPGTYWVSFIPSAGISGIMPGTAPNALDEYTQGTQAGWTSHTPNFYDILDVGIRISAVDAPAVPEPASLAIWGLGALGCAIAGYRRRKAA